MYVLYILIQSFNYMKKLSKISYLFMVLLFILAFSSCEKEKLTKKELLTSHIWRFDKITTTSTDEDILNLVVLVNALMTSATMEFREDGTYTLSVLNNTEDGTWELSGGDETLIMDGDEMTIIKLTEDELVLEGEEVDNDYGSYSAKLFWKK